MADFDVTESSDQEALKFLCGDSSRSVTDEHMETFDSMEALLREMNHAPSIEMPEFDASNVSDWLSKVERSFRVRRYSDLDKLDLVAFSLEGDALLWFDSEMTRSQIHSWDEFRHRLFLRFAAPPEASSETVTESLEARASYQVPVSSLEPGLSFSSASLVVSEAWQSDMVSINRVQSQFSLACVKNMNNAHRVFDELSHRRLKCQQRKKLSLSPKSWMFKYKPERRRSRKRHNQDIVRKSQEIFRKDGVTRGVFHTVDQVDIIRPMVEAVGWPLLAAEQVFVNSVKLASESVVEFFIALCGVSAEDLKQFPARVFSLQKLVEISYYNIARIRMVWARIWSVLAEHFVAAGSHHDEKIAMCAIDSLRQLGLQYLESSELSVISTVTSANFGGLQGLLEQVLQGDDEAYTKIFDKLQLILKQGMDLYGASGHGLFLRQQSFSSIWHRWRRKD